ncbi:hypothetical protein LPJ53_005765 [Coemansia erecta]|uniref:Uncharacterized protein n=1 Tax=Coemansia erecta TaxID=147472 RepID=A0A9W7XW24_9FUNG|nr:hypothetical protein LPJ53_005765 [Coemansia erecta]
MLSHAITEAFTAVEGGALLMLKLYHQFAAALTESQTAFGHVFQGFIQASLDNLDDKDLTTPVDDQLGHTANVGMAHYACSNLDFGQLYQHKMWCYCDLSCEWHVMLGLDKWALPGHFNPKIDEPCT